MGSGIGSYCDVPVCFVCLTSGVSGTRLTRLHTGGGDGAGSGGPLEEGVAPGVEVGLRSTVDSWKVRTLVTFLRGPCSVILLNVFNFVGDLKGDN